VAIDGQSDRDLTERTVARLIGERLRAAGVRHVTGHPGGEVVDLIEGFREAGLEFVLTRHENGGGVHG
jgi:acetolactate synthase-1/2/3 large subunit